MAPRPRRAPPSPYKASAKQERIARERLAGLLALAEQATQDEKSACVERAVSVVQGAARNTNRRSTEQSGRLNGIDTGPCWPVIRLLAGNGSSRQGRVAQGPCQGNGA